MATSRLTIRPFSPTDAEEMARIYNHYITETTVSFETKPLTTGDMLERVEHIAAEFPCFVAEQDGRVAGYCYAHLWKERAAYSHTWEVTIYFDPQYTGRGVGRKMMGMLIEACRQTGRCHSLIACITAENKGSIAFHGSMGFEEVSCFKQVGYKLGRRLDVVDMQLML